MRALNRNFVTSAMLKKAAFDDKILVEKKHQYWYFFGEKEIIRTPLLKLLEVFLLL